MGTATGPAGVKSARALESERQALGLEIRVRFPSSAISPQNHVSQSGEFVVTLAMESNTHLTHKHLLDEGLWLRLTVRLAKDQSIELSLAERIMDQTIGFMLLCSADPNGPHYAPSPLVDEGWHTFILYTKEYATFCRKISGGYIHHEPFDQPGVTYETDGVIARTREAMKDFGPDPMLWEITEDYPRSGSFAWVER